MAHLSKILSLLGLFIFSELPALRAQTAYDLLSSTSQIYYNTLLEGLLSFLTTEQRTEFEDALYPALEKNPDLVPDGLALLKEGGQHFDPSALGGSDAYAQKLRDYEARLRTAMTTQDANIGKIFDQIDAHLPHPANP